jgi:hypothetical protein
MSSNNEEKLVQLVTAKIEELIASGKITVANVNEFIKQETAKITRTMPLMNKFGVYSMIAKNIGAKLEEEPEDQEAGEIVETELQIKDLPSRINDHGTDSVMIKGKVVEAAVKTPNKKDKKTGATLEEKWKIAEIKLADPTGMTIYSQFYADGLDELFEKIDDGSIVGKILTLHNVKVEKPKFSGLETQVSIKRGGSFDLTDGTMETGNTKPVPTPISTVADDAPHYFLVKVLKASAKTLPTGKQLVNLFVKDEKGDTADATLWFEGASAANYPKDSTILVEARMKSREYAGKIYKSLSVNKEREITVNPEGYVLNISSSQEVEKHLSDIKVGEKVSVIAMFGKIFAGENWKPYYLACPVVVDDVKHRECGKSVTMKDGSGWSCGNNHTLDDTEASQARKCINLAGTISDGTTITFKILDKGDEQFRDGTVKESVMHKLTGKLPEELVKDFSDLGSTRFHDWLSQKIGGKFFKLTGWVKEDDYRGDIVVNISGAAEVDENAEIERVRNELKIAI